MDWRFSPGEPLYTQLGRQLTLAIVSGAYPPGARLPAVREMAAEAGVNPNTMQRALSELERRGLVCAQRTAGCFVTEDAGCVEKERRALAEEQARDFLDAMEALGYNRVQSVVLLEKIRNGRQEGEAHGVSI